jgi:hypothetical protein
MGCWQKAYYLFTFPWKKILKILKNLLNSALALFIPVVPLSIPINPITLKCISFGK